MGNFKKILLNGEYIKWFSCFTKNNPRFNTSSIVSNNNSLTEYDKIMLKNLNNLYNEITLYQSKKGFFDLKYVCLKHDNLYYLFTREKNYICCLVYDKKIYMSNNNKWYSTNQGEDYQRELPVVQYEDLLRSYTFEEKAEIYDVNYLPLETLINRASYNPEFLYKNIYKYLTQQEIELLINDLENKHCFNCSNCECPKDISKFKNEEDFICDDWKNEIVIGKSRVLKITDVKKLF